MRIELLLTTNKNIEQAMKYYYESAIVWRIGMRKRKNITKEQFDIENGRDHLRDGEMAQKKRNWIRDKNVNLLVPK